MATISFSILRYWMKADLTDLQTGVPAFSCHGDLRLYQAGIDPEPFILYVGYEDDLLSFIRVIPADPSARKPYCFLCCNYKRQEALSVALPPGCSVLYTAKALPLIFNKMAREVSTFIHWYDDLKNVLYRNEGIQKLLDRSSFLPGTLILTNAGYKLQAVVYKDSVSDPTIDEVKELGYHTFETIERIHKEEPVISTPDTSEYISKASGNYTIIRLLHYKDRVAARLCLILDGPQTDPAYSDFMEILSAAIARYLFNKQSVDYASNAELGSLVSDIIEGRIVDQKELDHRMKQVRLIAHRYFHLMLVSFDQSGNRSMIPWNYVISQLQYIFPYSNITTYNGDILLIIQKRQRKSRVRFNEKHLMSLLEQYNGFSCMGNASEFMMSLPPMYHQVHGALRLGRHIDPDKRIYYYEDYAMYQIIELAADSEIKFLSSRNLAHLCNNEMIALVMYDQKNDTDMADILLTFLKYERNTTKAAEALYMHRNTLLYKIKKIEEIIDRDLEDPDFRSRMLFSGYVLDYMRKYRKEDILQLQRDSSRDKQK
ncbi:MAG: helix-turn-helix domain-containing protein [Lachnospiraceae bacterium]|nr:helix-turn-helix domain-containing protein [Lachnospiraceae bacterium]